MKNVQDGIQNNSDNFGFLYNKQVTERFQRSQTNDLSNLLDSATGS